MQVQGNSNGATNTVAVPASKGGLHRKIRSLITQTFDPEVLEAMSEAYDKAAALITDGDLETAEKLAVAIIAAASSGERNPEKLAATALNEVTDKSQDPN